MSKHKQGTRLGKAPSKAASTDSGKGDMLKVAVGGTPEQERKSSARYGKR